MVITMRETEMYDISDINDINIGINKPEKLERFSSFQYFSRNFLSKNSVYIPIVMSLMSLMSLEKV